MACGAHMPSLLATQAPVLPPKPGETSRGGVARTDAANGAYPAMMVATDHSFAQLMALLAQKHHEQVGALRAENARLRIPAGLPISTGSIHPSRDEDVNEEAAVVPSEFIVPIQSKLCVQVAGPSLATAVQPRGVPRSRSSGQTEQELQAERAALAAGICWTPTSVHQTSVLLHQNSLNPIPRTSSNVLELGTGAILDATRHMAAGVLRMPDEDESPASASAAVPKRRDISQDNPHVRSQHNRLQNLMENLNEEKLSSKRFQAVMSILNTVFITLNILIMVVKLEQSGEEVANVLGLKMASPWPTEVLDTLDGFSHVFCVFFTFDLLVNLYFFRCSFFVTKERQLRFLNMIDAMVVMMFVWELYILPYFNTGVGSDLSLFRLFRLLRMVRALRVVRTLKSFSKLRVLMSTAAHNFFDDSEVSDETKLWMYKLYGTPRRSFWAVFELTMSGGWPNWSSKLIEEVSPWFAVFFFVYVSAVVFAMTRIISALFLRDTLAVASSDTEMIVDHKASEKQSYAEKLLDVFYAADTSADGLVSIEEFDVLLVDPQVKAYISFLELDASDSRRLFAMIDEGNGTISPEEFVKGALRLKGQARTQDVVQVMVDCEKIKKAIAVNEKILRDIQLNLRGN